MAARKKLRPEDRVLDWRGSFDPRNKNYPVQAVLATAAAPVTTLWAVDQVLDQGSEGSCVGHAWAHELLAEPVAVQAIDHLYAVAIYLDAQRIDEWPGEDYSGTSVLAGAKTVQTRELITGYRWAFGLQDVLDTLGTLGPVVLGCSWLTGMDWPDENGWIKADGDRRGGHAILIRGVNFEDRYVTLHNSWGPGWGLEGTAKLPFDDLDRLLGEGAEACVPMGRRLVPPAPEPPAPEPTKSWWAQLLAALSAILTFWRKK